MIGENIQTGTGMLTLVVHTGDGVDLPLAGDRIRLLPDVLRVRVDANCNQLEVGFQTPADELLNRIHRALQLARNGTLDTLTI